MDTNYLMADSVLDTDSFDTAQAKAAVVEDRFATTPMLPTVPAFQPMNEEELHTSFEQAISDRVLVVSKQLSLKSGPLVDTSTQRMQVNTEPLHHSAFMTDGLLASAQMLKANTQSTPFTTSLGALWQRSFIFIGLALMFMLAGFDLMGLLVLYAH